MVLILKVPVITSKLLVKHPVCTRDFANTFRVVEVERFEDMVAYVIKSAFLKEVTNTIMQVAFKFVVKAIFMWEACPFKVDINLWILLEELNLDYIVKEVEVELDTLLVSDFNSFVAITSRILHPMGETF